MKTITKVLITSLAITALGSVLICINSTIPAGIVALSVGILGLAFGPLIAILIDDSK